ncbi:MAG: TatD family hydrolase [Bacillota bacterium]|nr:TatD family hydrolase [Bacillota bacterium]
MHDAHFHFSKKLVSILKEKGIDGICNVSTPLEYSQIEEDIFHQAYHFSCGIHPWSVDQISYDTFFPYLEKTNIVGEIGLDNTWCQTDLSLQKEVFEKQLQYASASKKTVILHLKGMEKEGLKLIKKYPNTYIVHWHSSMDCIQEFKEMGCFFTIGPSVGMDACVDEVVKQVDLDHLLIESDGISALEWAFETSSVDYLYCLNRSLQEISRIKNLSVEQIEEQLDLNFKKICAIV